MARTSDPARVAARRETISAAAGKLFAEHGFEHTTASQIASEAGLSSASVFYYFEDKRALFRSIFERDIPISRALVDRCLSLPDPIAAILTMVDELAADALTPHAQGILVELLRQAGKDPALVQTVTENASILHAGFTTLIDRGQQAALVDSTLDSAEAAFWIQSIIDSAFLTADPTRDPRPMLRRIVTKFLAPTKNTESTP